MAAAIVRLQDERPWRLAVKRACLFQMMGLAIFGCWNMTALLLDVALSWLWNGVLYGIILAIACPTFLGDVTVRFLDLLHHGLEQMAAWGRVVIQSVDLSQSSDGWAESVKIVSAMGLALLVLLQSRRSQPAKAEV